jgi:acetyltransferase-like isoleucine patch superfamily enzyme
LPPSLPLPGSTEQWAQTSYPSYAPYPPLAGPGSMLSQPPPSSSHHSGEGDPAFFHRFPELIEKDKMLRGQPYMHYTDSTLIHERNRCLVALNQYNNAFDPNQGISPPQRADFFTRILNPGRRPNNHGGYRIYGPKGDIGDRTLVESPFKCDFGYNVHLGHDCVISSDCYLQDGGGIFIGDRVIVGTRTQILTMTASLDARERGGSQGRVRAGVIRIEDDVFIGAGCIILPYVTIKRGAVVGAGSVVTRVRRLVALMVTRLMRTSERRGEHGRSRQPGQTYPSS